MTAKADFNADEWTTITDAPLMAAMRVVTAERGGAIRESLAVARAYAAARETHGESALLDAVVATPPTPDPSRFGPGTDVAAAAAERLREAVSVLEAKAAPEDTNAYKQFVVTVAEAVASANKEGGFAGIGGTPVSDNEQAALDEIRSTLGLTQA